MRKPAFLSNERLSRFVVSLLLCVGVTLPLMMTFGAGGSAALSLLISAAILGLMTALGSMKKGPLDSDRPRVPGLPSFSCFYQTRDFLALRMRA